MPPHPAAQSKIHIDYKVMPPAAGVVGPQPRTSPEAKYQTDTEPRTSVSCLSLASSPFLALKYWHENTSGVFRNPLCHDINIFPGGESIAFVMTAWHGSKALNPSTTEFCVCNRDLTCLPESIFSFTWDKRALWKTWADCEKTTMMQWVSVRLRYDSRDSRLI